MWHTKDVYEVGKAFETNIGSGLNDKLVEGKRLKFGENKLTDKKKESIIIKFLKQFNDFMIIILIISSIISAVVTKLEGSGDYLDSIIIISITVIVLVVISCLLYVVLNKKKENAI